MPMIWKPAAAIPALLFAATPALADLTAEDVWRDWQALSAKMGQTLSAGAQARTTEALTLSDVTMEMEVEGGSIGGSIGEIVMRERGDGTVEITMAPEFPMTIDVAPPEGDPVQMTVIIRQTDLVTIASGDPGNASYAYSAPLIEIAMDEVIPEAEPVQMVMNMAVQDTAGTYGAASDDSGLVEALFDAAALIGTISMRPAGDADAPGPVMDMTFTMEDLSSESRGSIAAMTGFTALPQLLEAGYQTDGGMTYGASSYSMTVVDDDGTLQIDSAAESGSFDFALGPDGLVYGGANNGITLSVAGSMIPFPILNFAIDETEGRFVMPLTRSDDQKDFGLLLRIVNLRIDDMIWSIFDPQSFLPRDPATIVIDIGGQGRWNIEITDPEAAEAAEEMPGELAGLSLNELRLSLAGAELTGEGAFDFDNSDLETFDGMPRPEGAVTFNLTGANGLLDNLVAMGMLPEDEAMGARMMLGMFARPGEGDDALTSTVEVDDAGQVFANGQRIR